MRNVLFILSTATLAGSLIYHSQNNHPDNSEMDYISSVIDGDTTKKVKSKKVVITDTTKKDSLLVEIDSAVILPKTEQINELHKMQEDVKVSKAENASIKKPLKVYGSSPASDASGVGSSSTTNSAVKGSAGKTYYYENNRAQYKTTESKQKLVESYKSTNSSTLNSTYTINTTVNKQTISNNNQNTVKNSSPAAAAGLLTGGETNDLSKWSLWNDMVKTALEQQISTWKIYPYNRYAVLLQTKDNMPVQGAKVSLLTKSGEIMWEAITDNTGAAQLWKNIYKEMTDTNVAEIKISYKGNEETIKNPVDYLHGINTKKLKVKYEKPEIVDIAFVVDATASMQDEIDFLKEEMNDIISNTKNNYKEIDLYMGAVFYRCIGNSYTTKHKPLTKDHSQIVDFIRENNSGEGGMEAVEEALNVSLNKLNWHESARTRLLFLVLDEPPGNYDTIVSKLHTQIRDAAKRGIKIIPVVASGRVGSSLQNRNMEYLMRSAALATNGNYIFITDHSGIGGPHTDPIIDNYKVELINDIITRTIKNNIYMPDEKELIPETVKDTLLINNKEDVVSKYLDSLSEVMSDDDFLTLLLPYTDFKTKDEMKEHLPLEKIDTTAFLNAQKKEVYTLKVYPNPSRGELKAEFNTDTDWLYVADLSGKIIERISSYETRLVDVNLTNYPNGFYMIQYMVKEKWISAKIVLQK